MKKQKFEEHVKCDVCGYNNKKYFAAKYGKCNCCKNVIDHRAYFKYTLMKKLGLIRKGKLGEYYSLNK